MKITVKENHLEWALKHLQKYSHSDFYPRMFEFKAITHNWNQVKEYVLSLDLDEDKYQPKSPMINLAPKNNGNFRIVHQLEPVDSLIYTALVREVCEAIEEYRLSESLQIACSYRIKPDLHGSFFSVETGWDVFTSRSKTLADRYDKGFVIVADITDFYNQIYTHRIQNLIEEAGKGNLDDTSKAIENFLLGLNKKTSRGIPVGPAPSIVLAELIMASVDKKIQTYSTDFVRYVDDIRIFFNSRADALYALHELTQYLYSHHRLVFSGEKTVILPVSAFKKRHLVTEEQKEKDAIFTKTDDLAREKVDELFKNIPPYRETPDYDEEYEAAVVEIMKDEKFRLLSSAYKELFEKSINYPVDFAVIRLVLRKASKYRIRNLVPLVLAHFERLLPLIREVIIYLNAVIDETTAKNNKDSFQSILSAHYARWPFVNLWISHLLQNPVFRTVGLPLEYSPIISTRAKALVALRNQDVTWVRDFRDTIDVLGPWDKRAVLYSSSVLSLDEMKPWVSAVAASGDVIDKSLSSLLVSEKSSHK